MASFRFQASYFWGSPSLFLLHFVGKYSVRFIYDCVSVLSS